MKKDVYKISLILINILIINIFGITSDYTYADTISKAVQALETNEKEDVNEDGIIDSQDLDIVSGYYNVSKGESKYNIDYDINEDGIIDIYDIVRISKKLGTSTIKIGYVYNVGSTGLNVRSGPGTNYGTVGKLYEDNEVEIVNSSNANWYKIDFNGSFAYVHKDYVTNVKPSYEFNYSLDYYVDIQSAKMNLTDKGGSWRDATKDEIKYYMNPDNFTNNDGKYMFLKLNYAEGIPVSVVNEVVSGRGILSGKGQAFLTGGEKYNINPIYLACHARLETGNGTSKLSNGVLVSEVDGQAVTPKVVYNMFGIGAIDQDALKYGSEYAYKQGWFTPELAIIEGAKWIGQKYINNTQYKQNTLYEMRWNLNKFGVGYHQYATDIGWAYKQATMMAPYLNKCTSAKFEYRIPEFKLSLREAAKLLKE